VRQELQLLNPRVFVIHFAMPILVALFLKNASASVLHHELALPDASGADQAVPGMALLFLFFLTVVIGLTFCREHGWRTWDRVRASRARMGEVVLAKLSVPFVVGLAQLASVLLLGWALLGMHVRGSVAALVAVCVAVDLTVLGIGLLLVSLFDRYQVLSSVAQLLALVLAGFGGAMQPVQDMPGWIRAVAPATPHYWAMRAFRQILVSGAGLGDVLGDVMVLLAFGVVLLAVGAALFRPQAPKYWLG
jgi:ABC-2 type transport system permease protein